MPLSAAAQEAKIEVLAEGLSNPFAVAVQPETDVVYVAESGAQRVVRYFDGKIEPVITGFPASKADGYVAGPMSLMFMERSGLWVGRVWGDEGCVSLYRLQKENVALKAFHQKQYVAPEKIEGMPKLANYRSLAFHNVNFYAIGEGVKQNWISLGELSANGTLTGFRPAIEGRQGSVERPAAVTVDPLGGYLAVTRTGKPTPQLDGLLSMYSLSGKWLADYPLEVRDPVSVAYNSVSQRMFVLDANYANPEKGGLYAVYVDSQSKCVAKKLCEVPWGRSMMFDSKGHLFVTSLGADAKSANQKPAGKLLRITIADETKGESNE